MRIPVLFILFFCGTLFTGLQAQFTPGNLTVFRAEAAASNNTAFSIIELQSSTSNQAAPVTAVLINGTSGSTALRTSGSASSTGYLANSNDGSLICFTAHNSISTSANANTLTARGVGTLDAGGVFSLAATYTGSAGNQTRSATSLNNSTWFIADQGGLYTNGTTVANPAGNFRSIKSFGGNVYVLQASASIPPVSTVTAPSGGTITSLPGLPNGSSAQQDFYLISSGNNGAASDVLYILAATSATAGTIAKYSMVAGTWLANGSYTTNFGGFGIAAATSGNAAFLYITTGVGATAGNSVIKLTDDAGYNAAMSITTANNSTLYTSATGTTLKGIAFTPVATSTPNIVATPANFNFGTVNTGASSVSKAILFTGAGLSPASGGLTATASNSNFEIYDGSNWGSTASINYSNNGTNIDNMLIRFSPQSAGLLAGNITVSGGGLSSPVIITLTGTGNNSLSFEFSTATTAALNPPYISGTLNHPADPAAITGIITTVKESSVDIPADNYSIAATSSNTTVVPVANIIIAKANGSSTIKVIPADAGYADITLTLTKGADIKSLVIHYAASSAATPASNWHTGIADASAALALDDDYMAIANDESNLLYVFNRSTPGLPVKTYDFNETNQLGLTDGSAGAWKEVDVEAVAISPLFAGRSYWLGSMSNSSSYNNKPNRNRLFAINTSGTGPIATFNNAGYYNGMRQQLITWGDASGYNFSASAADGKDAKLIDGFNAEGMVFAPNNSTLYIGFRAPLVPLASRTKAVIAPLQNFETWFNNGAPSGNISIGTAIELDLGGRGIRDMIRLSNGTYIIIAGSYDDVLRPALYRWTGNPPDAAILLSSFDLTGLNVEAAIGINVNGQSAADKLQIICDDGNSTYYNDGIAAKDLVQNNYKKFISQVIQSSTESLLPVHFEYFTAQRQAEKVQLNWKTGYQDDATAFDILRSENGNSFSKIGAIGAMPNQNIYRFVDNNAPARQVYYRIGAQDAAGKAFLSTIRSITGNGINQQFFNMYPNPVSSGTFSITLNKPGIKKVSIYNSLGMLYQQLQFNGTIKEISTVNWPKGHYLLRIFMDDDSLVTEKLIVQ